MMNNVKWTRPPTPPPGRESLVKTVLLGLLSMFEVSFDLLSLVAALLGGVTRASDSTSTTQGTNTIPAMTTETPHQFASQVVIDETPSRRPVGITIMAGLLGFLGLLEVVFGALALVTSLIGTFVVPLTSPPVGAALGVYYLLLGLVKLFFAWGLFRLQRWAFWATVFIAALSLLSSFLAVTQPPPTTWAFLADLLIPAAILVYFVLDAKTRRAFRI